MTRICSILVFPLIGLLFALSVMSMPYWKLEQLQVMPELGGFISGILMVMLCFVMFFVLYRPILDISPAHGRV